MSAPLLVSSGKQPPAVGVGCFVPLTCSTAGRASFCLRLRLDCDPERNMLKRD